MSIRGGRLQDSLGKTIEHIVIRHNKEREKHPGDQLFFVFSDGTYLEIFGDLQNGSVHEGDVNHVIGCAKQFGGDIELLGKISLQGDSMIPEKYDEGLSLASRRENHTFSSLNLLFIFKPAGENHFRNLSL
jgi:hypothetical protein